MLVVLGVLHMAEMRKLGVLRHFDQNEGGREGKTEKSGMKTKPPPGL